MPKDEIGSYSQNFAVGGKRVAGRCLVSLTWEGAGEGANRLIFGMLPDVSFRELHRITAAHSALSSDARLRITVEIYVETGGIARRQVDGVSLRTLFDVYLVENVQIEL